MHLIYDEIVLIPDLVVRDLPLVLIVSIAERGHKSCRLLRIVRKIRISSGRYILVIGPIVYYL